MPDSDPWVTGHYAPWRGTEECQTAAAAKPSVRILEIYSACQRDAAEPAPSVAVANAAIAQFLDEYAELERRRFLVNAALAALPTHDARIIDRLLEEAGLRVVPHGQVSFNPWSSLSVNATNILNAAKVAGLL